MQVYLLGRNRKEIKIGTKAARVHYQAKGQNKCKQMILPVILAAGYKGNSAKLTCFYTRKEYNASDSILPFTYL